MDFFCSLFSWHGFFYFKQTILSSVDAQYSLKPRGRLDDRYSVLESTGYLEFLKKLEACVLGIV